MPDSTLESVLSKSRSFNPPADFVNQSYVRSFRDYEQLYSKAAANFEGF